MRSTALFVNSARIAVNMALPSILKMTPAARAVFEQLAHGDRRPTAAPVWATLEVTREGFATGALAARLAADSEGIKDQLNLLLSNSEFLSRMSELLHQGNYSIDLPEHAALLVVAWCLEVGDEAGARSIIAEIGPYMADLQFFPRVTSNAAPLGTTVTVSLGTLGDTRRQLQDLVVIGDVRCSRDMARTASVNVEIQVWQGHVVALLARTLGAGRFPCQGAVRKNDIPDDCAQPFQRPVVGDLAQMQCLLAELSLLLRDPGVSKRHSGRGGATALLRRSLELLVAQGTLMKPSADPAATSSAQTLADVNAALARLQRHIREVMASVYTRWSIPGSDEFQRAQELVTASRKPRDHTGTAARLMLDTLATRDNAEVLTPAHLTHTVNSLPEHLRTRCASVIKALRISTEGTLEELVDTAVIQSAEQCGTVCSRLVPKIKASTKFGDVVLRRLYEQLQTAFNRRRSLVLAVGPGDFQSQVRLDELPWAQPILAAASRSSADTLATARCLQEAAHRIQRVLWTRFPTTLVPNKVIRSLQQLRRPDDSSRNGEVYQNATLELDEESNGGRNAPEREMAEANHDPVSDEKRKSFGETPLVEELAADIFGGCFSPKFTLVARKAAALLEGSLYCRYYCLSDTYRALLRMDATRDKPRAGPPPDELLPLVRRLVDRLYPVISHAGRDGSSSSSHSGGWSVSGNGRQIEAAQVITTHNLIQLLAVDASVAVDSSAEINEPTHVSVARDAVAAIWKLFLRAPSVEQSRAESNWAAFKRASQHRRQEAIAWRQFVFALSLLSPSQQSQLLEEQRVALVGLKRYERIRARACELIVGLHACVVNDSVDNLNPRGILLGWRSLNGESS